MREWKPAPAWTAFQRNHTDGSVPDHPPLFMSSGSGNLSNLLFSRHQPFLYKGNFNPFVIMLEKYFLVPKLNKIYCTKLKTNVLRRWIELHCKNQTRTLSFRFCLFGFLFVCFFFFGVLGFGTWLIVIDSEDFCRLDFRTVTSRQTSAIICHVICASCYVESWLNPAGSRGIYCAAGGDESPCLTVNDK